MAAPTIVQSVSVSPVTDGSKLAAIEMSWETTPTAGNLLIAAFHARGGSALTIGVPAGWSVAWSGDYNTSSAHRIYTRIAGSSEPGSATWTLSPSHGVVGGLIEVSGQVATDPIVDIDGNAGSLSTVTVTSPGANHLAIGFGQTYGINSATPDGEWSAIISADNSLANTGDDYVFLAGSARVVGTGDVTPTWTASANIIARQAMIIAPSSPPPTVVTLDTGHMAYTPRAITATGGAVATLDTGHLAYTPRAITAAGGAVATLDTGHLAYTPRSIAANVTYPGQALAVLATGHMTYTPRPITAREVITRGYRYTPRRRLGSRLKRNGW